MEPNFIRTTPPMPENPRPIVIIGAGGIVNDAHLPAYRKAGFPVAGIFDIDPQKAGRMARTFELPAVYPSLETAVNDAPLGTVFDVAIPASAILGVLPHLPDGAGVLIQKPMGEDLATARAIRDLCNQKGLKAGINFQLRYAPFALAARSLIDSGYLGELHDMEVRVNTSTPWHLWKFFETVAFVEITYHSIHYLDLMRSFIAEPKGIYAKTVKHPKAAHIDGTSSDYVLDYGDCFRAMISTNHHHEYGSKHQESYVKWEGTQGAIKAQMGVLLNYPTGLPDSLEYCLLQENRAPVWQNVPLPGNWFPDAFIGTMASVLRAVEGSADEIPTSVNDAYKTMALVNAACRSSASGATPLFVHPQDSD